MFDRISRQHWETVIKEAIDSLQKIERMSSQEILENIQEIQQMIRAMVESSMIYIPARFSVVNPLFSHQSKMVNYGFEMILGILLRDSADDQCYPYTFSENREECCEEFRRIAFYVRALFQSAFLFVERDALEEITSDLKIEVNIFKLLQKVKYFGDVTYNRHRETPFVTIRLECPENLSTRINEEIVILMHNIIVNAVEHGKAKTISIEARKDEGTIVIIFSDNGEGIDEEKFPDANQIFARGESGQPRKGERGGVGLRDLPERGITGTASHHGGLPNQSGGTGARIELRLEGEILAEKYCASNALT